ncbi:hypothetical protein [Streptomyces sp. H27-S2]|nr:hypothetical protein [Streptomyces sp. H27-S2]MCY0951529.1 hypothetical protein [Streptomyces sp. H27-S2]
MSEQSSQRAPALGDSIQVPQSRQRHGKASRESGNVEVMAGFVAGA